ncbi:MAG: hypothetical protein ACI9VS_002544 [Candidatus Binatia bacterium]|jgi:hypothetical protein
MEEHKIIPFDQRHFDSVVALWRAVFGYETAHNDPALIIEKKRKVSDGLFFVAVSNADEAVGVIMSGYDGHRGRTRNRTESRHFDPLGEGPSRFRLHQ